MHVLTFISDDRLDVLCSVHELAQTIILKIQIFNL